MFYLASLPLALPFFLLFVLRQSGLRTSFMSALGAVAVAGFFTANIVDLLPLATHSIGHALAIAFGVLTVLFPGLLLYRLQAATGGLATIARLIQGIFQSQEMQVLALVIGASPFVESISGFGGSILLIAPLLLALGYSPLKAGILVLVSQISIPLGALGVGTMIGARLAGLPFQQLGVESVLLSAPLPMVFALVSLGVAGGKRSLSRFWWAAAICGAIKGVSDYYFAHAIGIEVAGSLSGLVVLLTLSGLTFLRKTPREHVSNLAQGAIWSAIAPYAILIMTLLITRTIAPLHDLLVKTLVIEPFGTGFRYALLYIPGFWVMAAALSVVPINGMDSLRVQQIVRQTWKQFLPAATTIVFFLVISQIMILSGMTATIASAGALLGHRYALVVPLLGAVGGWLTGSNSGGNAMFMPLQVAASNGLQLPMHWTAATQNATAGYATMASPPRVAFASVTVGDIRIEGKLLRAMVPYIVTSVVIIGAIYCYLVL